jgi:hypothetical protein
MAMHRLQLAGVRGYRLDRAMARLVSGRPGRRAYRTVFEARR